MGVTRSVRIINERPEDDVFGYSETPPGTYNDSFTPWAQLQDPPATGEVVVADPRKGKGMRQWAAGLERNRG